MAAVRNYGEMGLATFLASRSKVRNLDADPPIEQELRSVLIGNHPEVVKLYYTLRMVPQWRMQSDGVPIDLKLARFMKNKMFDNPKVLSALLISKEEFEAALARHAPELVQWQSLDGNFVSVAGQSSKLGKVAKASNQFRDDHMFNKVIELVGNGERVFLIAGNDHLAAQRPRLSSEILKRRPD